jgi:hypothetical protein
MPRQCYTLFIWGLIFTILDLKLNVIEVLPDFVGYFLVGMGESRISPNLP